MSLISFGATPDASACSCSFPPTPGSRRSTRRSSIETISIDPSGSHPSPDGVVSTFDTTSTEPSAPTRSTSCACMSETYSAPSCHRGPSRNARPPTSVSIAVSLPHPRLLGTFIADCCRSACREPALEVDLRVESPQACDTRGLAARRHRLRTGDRARCRRIARSATEWRRGSGSDCTSACFASAGRAGRIRRRWLRHVSRSVQRLPRRTGRLRVCTAYSPTASRRSRSRRPADGRPRSPASTVHRLADLGARWVRSIDGVRDHDRRADAGRPRCRRVAAHGRSSSRSCDGSSISSRTARFVTP